MGATASEPQPCSCSCSGRCNGAFQRSHETTSAEDEPTLMTSEPILCSARADDTAGGGATGSQDKLIRQCAKISRRFPQHHSDIQELGTSLNLGREMSRASSQSHGRRSGFGSRTPEHASAGGLLWSGVRLFGSTIASNAGSNHESNARTITSNAGSNHESNAYFSEPRKLDNEQSEAAPLSEPKRLTESEPESFPLSDSAPNSAREPESEQDSPRAPEKFMNRLQRRPSFSLQVNIENYRSIGDYYNILGQIGKGSFGSVKKATVKATNAVRAVKMVPKEKVNRNSGFMQREIEIMKAVDHPNIVKLCQIFEDDEYMYLVMELCTGGTLEKRLRKKGKLPEAEAADIFRQILQAVCYLHQNQIVHRDIKTENCLLTQEHEENVRVTDFGISCKFNPGQLLTARVGTPEYMSPQVFGKSYNQSCDMWSCGVLLHALLCGYLPFSDKNEEKMKANITAGKLSFEAADWVDASASAMELVTRLLTVDPDQRLTADKALRHQWIQTFGSYLSEHPIDVQLITNLLGFRSLNKFKRAALCVIASLLGEDQIGRSRQCFIALDSMGVGSVKLQDLLKRLPADSFDARRSCNIQNSLLDPCEAFTYTEFLAATFDRCLSCKADVCWAAFNVFDTDQDGSILPWELAQDVLLGSLTPDEMDRLMVDLDRNGDGGIDFQEFVEMMRDGEGYSPLPPFSPQSRRRFKLFRKS